MLPTECLLNIRSAFPRYLHARMHAILQSIFSIGSLNHTPMRAEKCCLIFIPILPYYFDNKCITLSDWYIHKFRDKHIHEFFDEHIYKFPDKHIYKFLDKYIYRFPDKYFYKHAFQTYLQ